MRGLRGSRSRRSLLAPLGLVLAAVLAACGSAEPPTMHPISVVPAYPGKPPAKASSSAAKPAAKKEVPVSDRIKTFVPAKISADVSKLPKGEKAALDHLIAASKLLEPIFDRQAYAKNPELREALAKDTSAAGKDKLAYFDIMRGPWDRQDHHHPFAVDFARPPGGGFYPVDMSADEFKKWVAEHPADKKALEDLTTVVVRKDGKLVAIRYSEAYAEWLKPAAQHMEAAAKATTNKSLAKFLRSRAAAFLSDDYYQSDKDWMDLDSQVEVTIGPYETYEDDMFSYKASFESFVTVADPAASKDLVKYKKLLPDMEKNLPVPDEVKTKRGAESPIRVVDLVFAAGDARKSVQTIAFNLPNDERVRAEKGSKKVLLRNVIQTKFDLIMRPIAERILTPAQLPLLSSEAFFYETLFHELSHSLGPAFTMKDGKKVEVRVALEAAQSALEEGKADVMGAYNVLYMIDRKELPKDFRDKLLVSYFAGLFRSTRFGVAEAHGKGAAMQINRFLEEGAATQGPTDASRSTS
jgi:hypothetical protein